jgi:GxxExxY protein
MDRPNIPPPVLPCFDTTERILGVFYSVYNELGPGFPEFVYRRALLLALRQAGLEANEDVSLPVWFRGVRIVNFRVDLFVNTGPVLIEVKAANSLEAFHTTQTLGYLKATEAEVALILNFGRQPQFRRLIFENSRKSALNGGGQLQEC